MVSSEEDGKPGELGPVRLNLPLWQRVAAITAAIVFRRMTIDGRSLLKAMQSAAASKRSNYARIRALADAM